MVIFATLAHNGLLNKKRVTIMAKPIKDTPVLYDEDAYRFEMAAHNVVPLPRERVEEMLRVYEEVKKHCKFPI